MINRLFFIAFLFAALVFTTPAQNILKIGSPAPAFSGKLMDGSPVSLASVRGKVAVITFWTTRCIICRHEMPQLDRMVGQYDPRDVVFLAFTTENEHQVAGYLRSNKFHFQIVPDSFGTLLQFADRDRAGNVNIGYPAFFVLDGAGRVQHRSSGYDKTPAVGAAIDRLVAH